MMHRGIRALLTTIVSTVAGLALVAPAAAVPFFISTGNPDGLIATGSRPSGAGKIEIETGDDFVVGPGTLTLTSATFQGLLPSNTLLGNVSQVVVEIYRVFPGDSTNPPSGNVPTRVNSPSDVAFVSRDSAAGTLSFLPGILSPSFTSANSVLNGINRVPNQHTAGEGAVTGQQVQFNVVFTTPISLPGNDHYFFVPQVQLASGDFFWLSAPRPIVPPGTPFAPDLQTWIRNENLDPDWLRIGTDIVGTPTPFDAVFTLSGDLDERTAVPEPATLWLLGATMAGLGAIGWRRRRAT